MKKYIFILGIFLIGCSNDRIPEMIKKNDFISIQNMFSQGRNININSIDEYGNTYLDLAIIYDRYEMVNLFIQKGADINYVDSNGFTPLKCAILNKRDKIAKLLIISGSNLNDNCIDVEPVIYTAISENNIEILKYLIKYKSNVNIQYEHINIVVTPLQYCCRYSNNVEIVKLLVESGANFNIVDKNQNTLLHLVSMNIKNDAWEIADFLIKKGIDPNKKNRKGQTALELAEKSQIKFKRSKTIAIIKRKMVTP